MNGQPGNNLVPINNNEGTQPVPGSAVTLRSSVPAKPRNFLVTPAANDETSIDPNRGQVALNDPRFSVIGNTEDGNEIISGAEKARKYNVEGAEDIGVKVPSQTDPVMDTVPAVANPEAAEDALNRLGKVKENRGGFLKGLREQMGGAQEKWNAIEAKVQEKMTWYNNLKPKTKLAIGLTLTAGSLAGIAGGAPIIAAGIGVLKLGAKVASTIAMSDGVTQALAKKYPNLAEMSPIKQQALRMSILGTTALFNVMGGEIIGNAIHESGVVDKVINTVHGFNPFPVYAGTVPQMDEMGSVTGGSITGTPDVPNEGWGTSTVGTPGVGQDREYWPEKPSAGSEFGPGDRPEASQGGWGTSVVGAPEVGEKPTASVVRPTVEQGSGSIGIAPDVTAVSTPTGAPDGAGILQYDVASAPPAGAEVVFDTDGKVQGWNLPNGTFMNPDGTIAGAVAERPSDVWATTGPGEGGPAAVASTEKFEQFTREPLKPVEYTPERPNLIMDIPKAEPVTLFTDHTSTPPTATPIGGVTTVAPESGTVWTTGDGSPLTTSDGTPVQSSQGAGIIQAPAAAVSPIGNMTAIAPEGTSVVGVPAQPSVPTPATLDGVPATAQQPFKMSFAPNPAAPMTIPEMQQVTIFNNLVQSPKFDSALMDAAKSVDGDKSIFGSFGDKGALQVRNNFSDVIKNNPLMTVDNLLSTDPASLPTKEANMLKEARGVLKKLVPETMLNGQDVRNSTVLKVLQDNFK